MPGLELLRELRVRNDAVALLLADQRMPQMDGIGFLNEARKVYPDAKRALLTAYADTGAAINAINEVNVHYFFLKPWDPPSQHLYPSDRRPAGRLDCVVPPAVRGNPRAGYALVFEGVRRAGFPGEEPRSLSVDRR